MAMNQWCWIILLTFSVIHSDILKGSASIQLTGPATKEQSEEVRKIAKAKLKNETLIWLTENKGVSIDTLNKLSNFHLDNFIDTCMRFCSEENDFKGKLLTTNLVLTYNKADSALMVFNNAVDNAAIESWSELKNAQQGNIYQQIYLSGVRALFFATAHIGQAITNPDNPEKILSEEIRGILQNFFDKMKISSTNMILQGKTGQPVVQPPVVTVLIDSTPLSNFALTGLLQNGKVLFTEKTDENGKIAFKDTKIPFVQNGTLFYVSPDPGKVMNASVFVSAKNFGLFLRKSQDQNFIFKISRPLYTLDFKTTSVSQITIPPDFANASYIKTFLKDSCYMQESSGTTPSDLIISMHSQVFKYDYDETEETSLKVSCQITVKGLSIDPPRTKQDIIVFEKRYEQNVDIPYGLYFWEANTKLREALKSTIENL
ncbi:MAG TPA: hypothetical protein VHP36_02250 [Chitinispirillaceae bacterium]|nr:hypothetical protein [Chitinispirillaceae bacterium]